MLNKSKKEELVVSEMQRHLVEVELPEHIKESEEIEDDRPSNHQEVSYNLVRDWEMRVNKPVQRYRFKNMVAFALIACIGDPTSYQEAIQSKNNDKWAIVIAEKIEYLQKNQT